MPRCEVCDRGRNKANKVSFSNKHNRHFQEPNLQKCHVELPNGTHKRLRICTSCIRSFKFKRAAAQPKQAS